MGLKDVRIRAIKCLENGNFVHEERDSIDEKNLLASNEVQTEFVVKLLKQTTGLNYNESPHHILEDVNVHVCKPILENKQWYVKFYFEEPDTVFISVHLSI